MNNTVKFDIRDRSTRQFLYGIIIFIALFIWGVRSCISGENEKWNNVIKDRTIGTVTWIDGALRGEDDAMVTFYVNGEKYEAGIGTKALVGEKFIIEYDIENPSYNRVLRGNPLFLENEETLFTIAKLTNFVKLIPGYLTYEYEVKGQQNEHSIWVSDSIKQNFSNVKKGDYFKVEYLEKNPQRSKIYLDHQLRKE